MANEEKQVIVIPENNADNQKSYWSLVKYGKFTWKNKWWVLGTTVICGVAGLLITMFGINPSKQQLNSEFSLKLAIETEKDANNVVVSERFINGEQFNYSEIISKTNLETVKALNEKYSGINIDKIFEKGGISISIKSFDEKTKSDNLTHYQINANGSYFPNASVAQEFITDLINLQKSRNVAAISSYQLENYLGTDPSSYEFVHQLENLESQYNAIDSTFKDLLTDFPSSAVVGEGKTIQSEYNAFVNQFKVGSGTAVSDLNGQLVTNGYVKYTPGQEAQKILEVTNQSESYKQSLRNNINLRSSYKTNLDSLISSAVITPTDSNYFKKVLELEGKIEKVDSESTSLLRALKINGYDNTDVDVTTLTNDMVNAMTVSSTRGVLYHLANPTVDNWDQKCLTFASELQSVTSSLNTYRTTTNNVFHTVYLNYQNNINFYTPGIVAATSGISSALVAIIAAVVGLIASSLIATAIEISKEKEAAK